MAPLPGAGAEHPLSGEGASSTGDPGRPAGGGAWRGLDAELVRWLLPAALLALEFGVLTLLGDFPRAGPAAGLVPAFRVAMPVLFAAVASGWLMARVDPAPRAPGHRPLPPWRPGPALVTHGVAFAATAFFTWRLLGRDAPLPGTGPLLAWLGCVALSILLAFRTAAPLRWISREFATRWRLPLAALAAGLLAWRAMVGAEELWGSLSHGTLRAVAWLLGNLTGGVTVDFAERVIGLGDFEVEVDASCSGADSVGLVLLFQALWIALARSRIRMGRALLLLPLGAAAALAGNVLRITALMLVGASGSPDLAVGAFHSKLGWLFFTAIALASIAAGERLPWLRRVVEKSAGRGVVEPSPGLAEVTLVAPLLAAMSAGFLSELFRQGLIDHLYGLRVLAALLALAVVRPSLRSWRPSWSWSAILLGAGLGLAWVLLTAGDGRAAAAELAAMSPWAWWTWFAVRVLGSTLLIPLIEELAFRGWLLPWLASPGSARAGPAWSWPAAVLSSLAFGALHHHWVLGALAGVGFAVVLRRRGRLGDAVLAHAVCNGVIAVAAAGFGRWDLWT